MTPARRAQIKDVFNSAHEKPEKDRDAFLEQVCQGDVSLCEEVQGLLAAEGAGSLPSPMGTVLAQPAGLFAGRNLGRYRVEHQLGQGGMGTVYRAFDTQLRRPVALKVLGPEHAEDPPWRRRLLHEARAASGLNHPNIIAVYEVGAEAGVDFIAMELVDGKPLHQIIPRKGLPLAQVLEYAAQIADGLTKAHACGVIHRDLKPGNIMVTCDGLVKLLDFGLAQRVVTGGVETTVTMTPVAAGTPSYMSPEQAQAQELDARSDIFSFGAVLYEMLAGRRAFMGDTMIAQMEAVLHEEPPPLTGVPRELTKLVSRCLRKDRSRRMQHIEDVRRVLRELKDESVSGKGLAFTGAPRRLSRTRIALGLAALLAMGTGAAWWLSRQAAPFSPSTMTRITFEPGLAWQPSVSLDGKLIAYSSDRTGLFQIYVQQVRGTQSVQLTHSQVNNHFPSFSPDGSKVAFRSERDGGGIYLVDALGGPERRIANQGLHPQFSPDGSTIVYIVPASPVTGAGKLYLISSDGGTPRPLQPGFVIPRMGPGYSGPVWSPDGRFVLFDGAPETDLKSRGWWIAPVTGSAPIRLEQPPYGLRSLLRILEAWRGKHIYYSEGTAVGGMSLYRVPISTNSWKFGGDPQRLTSAGGMQTGASLSADGHLVFASMTSAGRLWWTPLKANQGVAGERLQSMPTDATVKMMLTAAAGGSRVAYIANLFGDRTAEIRIRDPVSGREDLIAFSGNRLPSLLRLSADGSRLAYQHVLEGKRLTYLTDSGGTATHVICEDCQLLSFFSNPAEGVVAYGQQLVREDLATGTREPLLKIAGAQLAEASISPDDRWVAFSLGRGDGTAGLYIAQTRRNPGLPDSWIPIAADRGPLNSVAWSPDGKMLYYSRNCDGFLCLWAQRLTTDGRPAGPPLAVFHSYNHEGLKIAAGVQFGITTERLYLLSLDLKGDLWTINVGAP